MVEQDDITFPELTVKQALNFAARLRLPGTDATRQERVDTLIKQMRLDGCCDTRIGGGISQGVSGGERKRRTRTQTSPSPHAVRGPPRDA